MILWRLPNGPYLHQHYERGGAVSAKGFWSVVSRHSDERPLVLGGSRRGVYWRLEKDTSRVIPGGGTHIQVGYWPRRESWFEEPSPWRDGQALEMNATAALLTYDGDGVVQAAIQFVAVYRPDPKPIRFLMNLYDNRDPEHAHRERVGSDGNPFISTSFDSAQRYADIISGRRHGAPWLNLETFAFRVRAQHIVTAAHDIGYGETEAGDWHLSAIHFSNETAGATAEQAGQWSRNDMVVTNLAAASVPGT